MREEGEGEAPTGAGKKSQEKGEGERNCKVLTTTHLSPYYSAGGEAEETGGKLSLGECGWKILL